MVQIHMKMLQRSSEEPLGCKGIKMTILSTSGIHLVWMCPLNSESVNWKAPFIWRVQVQKADSFISSGLSSCQRRTEMKFADSRAGLSVTMRTVCRVTPQHRRLFILLKEFRLNHSQMKSMIKKGWSRSLWKQCSI